MNIIRYSTPQSFIEMDRLLESALASLATPGSQARSFPVEVQEDAAKVELRAELPGVKREDLQLELAEGVLEIRATRKHNRDGQERSVEYRRSLQLGEEISSEGISATLQDGILTLTLPKREAPKPLRISVN